MQLKFKCISNFCVQRVNWVYKLARINLARLLPWKQSPNHREIGMAAIPKRALWDIKMSCTLCLNDELFKFFRMREGDLFFIPFCFDDLYYHSNYYEKKIIQQCFCYCVNVNDVYYYFFYSKNCVNAAW